MGDSIKTESQQELLYRLAREKIASGELPRATAARSWGGRGSGLSCCLCNETISDTGPEMELEFDGAICASALHFHLQCQSVWDMARKLPNEMDWTPLTEGLPPYDTVIEARVSLSGSRTVILGVVLTRAGSAHDAWLNATTNSALPAAWHPLEWRLPPGFEHPSEPALSPRRA